MAFESLSLDPRVIEELRKEKIAVHSSYNALLRDMLVVWRQYQKESPKTKGSE